MAKTKFFRIAVEGATTDGREIQRDWIQQMAASYNPGTYTARINCEHLRGFSPDTPFNAYGTILSLKAEEIDLAIDGKTERRLALFGEIDANDQLVEINRKGQKLFTSCEIQPNFAGTNKAYLVGLAVTDSPASLGTEMLKFAAGQGDDNPLAARKLHKDNLFTAATEATIELAAEPADEGKTLIALATDFFKRFTTGTPPVEQPTPEQQAPANDNDARFAEFAQGITRLGTAMQGQVAQLATTVAKLSADQATLVATLSGTPDGQQPKRPPATGGAAAFTATDC
ncbi:GPO family capsid scaffolding protein [Sphingomonas sp.]|uniref:GPO family capsid scaffolding protein n=1 Tax=Sphingomonas sp. TaxID=28214 RepID=UPI003B3A6BFD